MGFVPVALAFITLGAGAVFSVSQYAKMKRELPEDDSDIRPEDKLRTKTGLADYSDTQPDYSPTKQSSAKRGTHSRQPA